MGHFPRALPWAITFCPFRANAGIPPKFPFPWETTNHQFDGFGWLTAGKLTDRTAGEPRFLSPAEGPNPALRRYILEVFLTLNKLI